MKAQDCYIKLLDTDGLKPAVVSQHRVWDKQLFLDTRTRQYAQHSNLDERRMLVEITESEYKRLK